MAPEAMAVAIRNAFIASVMFGASKPIRRSSTCSTVGMIALAAARWVASNSISIRCAATTGSTAPARDIALVAAAVIHSAVTLGGVQMAAYRLTHSLTATVCAAGA